MAIVIDIQSGLQIAEQGPGNRHRFADLFRDVWSALPEPDRNGIVAVWKAGFGGERGPQLYLQQHHKWGEVLHYGMIMIFSAHVADLMPDHVLKELIAHELAHVSLYGSPNSRTSGAPDDTTIKEDEANDLANRWGFSMSELEKWREDHHQRVAEEVQNRILAEIGRSGGQDNVAR